MFYLIEITKGDTKVAGYSVYGYDTEKAAVAAFHKKLGTAMGSELYTSELVIVIGEDGHVVKRELYKVEE